MEGDGKRFPLVRTFWSNEKAMTLLFIALVAWQVPSWFLGSAALALRFAGFVALALLVDVVCNLVRYRRFLCSVSAAITAGVAWVLAPACAPASSYPLTLAAVAAALVFGKHLFGGTGRNALNPAMLALASMALASMALAQGGGGALGFASTIDGARWAAAPAWPLIVACACLPFLAFRPFAGGFFALGAAVPFVLSVIHVGGFAHASDPSLVTAAAYSLVTASVAMTDPVTVTAHPIAGALMGALAGAISGSSLLGLSGLSPVMLPFVILAVNALSRASDRLLPPLRVNGFLRLRAITRRSETILSGAHDDFVGFSVPAAETSVTSLSADEILSRMRSSGVIGLGGAGFPTDAKIASFRASAAPRKVLIVNGVECDPGLIHDKWLLVNKGKEIAEAIAMLEIACGAAETALAVKRDTRLAFDLEARLPSSVRIVRVPDPYPVGAERILIRRVTGVEVSPGAIPAHEGFLVLNVQTALAARAAALAGEDPSWQTHAREWYLTVADLNARKSRIVLAREGESLAAVFARAFPASSGNQFIAGGGLMQAYRAFPDDTVTPGVNFIARGTVPRFRESPQCSRCGRCAASCPAGLDVRSIADSVDAGNYGRAIALGAERCLSCGSCSVVCLAGKNLSHRLSLSKCRAREDASLLVEPVPSK